MPVRWSDDVDEVMAGDVTVAAAYITPAGGAVVTGVAPCGLRDRDAGQVGFTTSLGFGKKLERIIRNPAVAVAYHAREHGFSARPLFVLAQGRARVDLAPSPARLDAFRPSAEGFLGSMKEGRAWNALLREYYGERVFVDIEVDRILTWPNLTAAGPASVAGGAAPEAPSPQRPPKNGTIARVDMDRAAGQLANLPYRLLAFRGGDGLPVIAPVSVAGHDKTAIRLVAAPGLLPPGGRRAGFLAHSFRPQLVGLASRTFTGWLEVADDGSEAWYSPHTSKGFWAPPQKNLLLVSNGLFAKYGMWQARRNGAAERLLALVAATPAARPGTP
jgi:hypothetical protein